MQLLSSLFVLAALALPAGLLAQSPVGEWKASGATPEGETWMFQVSIKADNTYTVDFGADGQVEIKGAYSISGDQITVQDVEGSDCTGKGVYQFAVEGDNLTMTKVSDACEGRSGPEGVMRMTKA
jgi:hypothetical protein